MGKVSRLSVIAALCVTVSGCGSGPAATQPVKSANAASGPVHPVSVSDDAFGKSTHQLLIDGTPSQERMDLLAGVVKHQLERAQKRFVSGHPDAGVAALTGAFFLLRSGEMHPEMFKGRSLALIAAVDEAARVGNEGRALALYRLLDQTLPEGRTKKDVEGHLAALAKWAGATGNGGPMQAAGAEQRRAVERALLEATPEAISRAQEATVKWMQKALSSNIGEQPITSNNEREEAIEAYRAIRAGGAALTALYLRYGSPGGALDALSQADLLRVIPPRLRELLERAAEEGDPEAWEDLFRLFDSADMSEQPETALSAELARGAAFGAAVELFRLEPKSLRGAMPLAVLLPQYGMAEVAPLLLADVIDQKSDPEALGWALALVLRAIVSEDEVGQLPAARRVFEAAKPLLELSRTPRFAKSVRPNAARLAYVMGALELRSGELERARPHIETAVREEPTVEALTALARIDRQRGELQDALTSLKGVIELAQRQGDPFAEAEAQNTVFEIRRDLGEPQKAEQVLRKALDRALDARQTARSAVNQAQAERLLARVLEHYGDEDALRRATERAFEASLSDTHQLTATIVDASRRALTNGDLALARDAVHRAVDAQLEPEDVVYVALWLKLLERKLGVPSDGTAEEALASVNDPSRWIGRLRAWGLGKLSDQALLESARNRVQLTEAKFYTAMAKRAGGEEELALSKLREVARSEAVELVEVTIARDLLADHQRPMDFNLPRNVVLP